MRLLVYGVLLIVLSLLLFGFAGAAAAQIMRQQEIVCDLWVNDYRLSWPPKSMGFKECDELMTMLREKDKTGAIIKCACEVGKRT